METSTSKGKRENYGSGLQGVSGLLAFAETMVSSQFGLQDVTGPPAQIDVSTKPGPSNLTRPRQPTTKGSTKAFVVQLGPDHT